MLTPISLAFLCGGVRLLDRDGLSLFHDLCMKKKYKEEKMQQKKSYLFVSFFNFLAPRLHHVERGRRIMQARRTAEGISVVKMVSSASLTMESRDLHLYQRRRHVELPVSRPTAHMYATTRPRTLTLRAKSGVVFLTSLSDGGSKIRMMITSRMR